MQHTGGGCVHAGAVAVSLIPPARPPDRPTARLLLVVCSVMDTFVHDPLVDWARGGSAGGGGGGGGARTDEGADNPHAKDALATIEGGWVGGWVASVGGHGAVPCPAFVVVFFYLSCGARSWMKVTPCLRRRRPLPTPPAGRLKGTLLGVSSQPCMPLSVEGQAHRLIEEACNKDNLGMMYIWW